MPIEPDQPGGSNDPTRAHDPIDPTVAQEPVDATRVQGAAPRPETDPLDGPGTPLTDEPLRRRPVHQDRSTTWWPWALLAAILIGIVLFALLGGDDEDDDAVDTIDQTETPEAPGGIEAPDTSPEDTSVVTTAPPGSAEDGSDAESETTTPAAPEEPSATEGTVTAADGTSLFSAVQGDAGDADRLGQYAGTQVTGEGVEVLEVVDGQGFWIGIDDQQRIFARPGDDVAADVEAGDRISFEGTLEANTPNDSTDISEDQGGELYQQQGHHIELRSVTSA